MKTIVLELPDDVALEPSEAKMILAARMYDRGDLSAGQAAQLAGISKRVFIESLGRHGVSLFNDNIDALEQDIINARNSHR